MSATGFAATFQRMLRAEGQARSARTVEIFGWLMLFESAAVLFAPHWVAALLHLPALSEQGANYFRLVGLLVGGLGMLYVVSGRLNADGFTFPFDAGSAAGSVHHGRALVLWLYSGHACIDFLHH